MSGPAGAAILRLDEIDSTNAEARRRLEAGEDGPLWIMARRQTAGRGRRARAWDSPPGNLAATLMMTLRASPAEAANLAFVAALAAMDVADGLVDPALVALKWPNDVLVDGRKAVGVLIESAPRADGSLGLAIGIGVNLAHAPADAERPAVALAAFRDAAPDVDAAMDALAAAFAARFAQWTGQGFAAVRDAWLARAAGLGGPVVARLPQAEYHGRFEGLDATGALILRQASGRVRAITAGDVFF